MRLLTDITVGDQTIRVALPETTREVLTYRSFIAPRVQLALDSDRAAGLTDAVIWSIEWLADKCVEVDQDWLDEHLSPLEIHLACMEIVGAVSTPDDVAREIYENGKVLGLGGCQCAACREPEKVDKWDEKTREIVLRSCKFNDLSPVADHIIGTIHGFSDDPLIDCPHWLYDAIQRWKIGKAVGARERRRKEEKRQKMKSALRSAGKLRRR